MPIIAVDEGIIGAVEALGVTWSTPDESDGVLTWTDGGKQLQVAITAGEVADMIANAPSDVVSTFGGDLQAIVTWQSGGAA
jgi:phage tail sheath gpL-like